MSNAGFCPYVGLQPFTEADQPYFFGRERDARLIVANLQTAPLTVFYGPSGVGKSSVLMAGAIPLLRRRPHTAVAIYREWQQPDAVQRLKAAIIGAAAGFETAVGGGAFDAAAPLDELVKQVGERVGCRMVLILDQFEEYFAYHTLPGAAGFDAELARTVNRRDVDCAVMLSMRDDAIAKLDRFAARIANLLENRLSLGHLSTADAESAVRKPVARYNELRPEAQGHPMEIDDALVREVLDQVRSGQVSIGEHRGTGAAPVDGRRGAIETPFLQLVLTKLWEAEFLQDSRRLRLETFVQQLGGAQKIVRSHLGDVMRGQSAELQAVCARFFDRLVTPTGAKVALRFSDLRQYAAADADLVSAALRGLVEGRILRTISPPPGKPVQYELFHDVLAPAVIDWRAHFIADDQQRALARETAEREAAREKELRAARELAETQGRLALEAGARHRAEALRAREAVDRARVQRALTAFMGLLLLLAAALAAVSVWKSREADRQKAAADAGRLAAESQSTIADNFDQGLLLAIEAVRRKPTREATRALLDGLARLPEQQPYLRGHSDRVNSVAFSADSRWLASGSDDRTVLLWDVAARQRSGTPLEAHLGGVNSVAFSADGRWLASGGGGDQATVVLWDLQRRTPRLLPNKHALGVNSVAFSPDSTRLASGGADRQIVLWDVTNGSMIGRPLVGHDEGVTSLSFSPNGRALASVGADRRLVLWDLERGEPTFVEQEAHDRGINSVAFSATGTRVATGGADGRVILWDIATRRPPLPLDVGMQTVISVAFSADERLLAVGGTDRRITLWDTATGKRSGELPGRASMVNGLAFSPDGTLLASAGLDDHVMLWNFAARRPAAERMRAHELSIQGVAFSGDGRYLASVGSDRRVILWDVASRQPDGPALQGPQAAINGIAFSADGTRLATASDDRTVQLWDVSTRQPTGEPMKGHQGAVHRVAFGASGDRLASVGNDGQVWLWDLARAPATGRHLGGHVGPATSVAFSADGLRLASGGSDRKIRIWDAASGQAVGAPLVKHEGAVTDIAFSPDGRHLASVDDDGAALLWDLTQPSPAAAELPTSAGVALSSVAFSADGRLIAAAGESGAVVWDADTRRLQHADVAQGPQLGLTSIAFHPLSRLLALGYAQEATSAAGTRKVVAPLFWDLDQPGWLAAGCQAAARNLSCIEWRSAAIGDRYVATCPGLPAPDAIDCGVSADHRRERELQSSQITFTVLGLPVAALVFAPLAAWAFARRHRKAVAATRRDDEPAQSAPTAAVPPLVPLVIEHLSSAMVAAPDAPARDIAASVERGERHDLNTVVAAGSLFAAVAATLYVLPQGADVYPPLAITLWLLFAGAALPAVLHVAGSAFSRRLRPLAVYALTALVVAAALQLLDLPASNDPDALVVPGLAAGMATLLWWLLGIDGLRATGRIVLCGLTIGTALVPITMLAARAVEGTLAPREMIAPLGVAAGLVAGVVILAVAMRLLAGPYRKQRFSDRRFVVDLCFVNVTAWLVMYQTTAAGLLGLVLLLPLAVYLLAMHLAQRWRPAPVAGGAVPRLLFVDGLENRRHRDRLEPELERRWRHAGPVDRLRRSALRGRELGPADVLAFFGRPRASAAVADVAAVDARVAEPGAQADPDGRFRVACTIAPTPSVWRHALRCLAGRADAVLLDARGFTALSPGVVREGIGLLDGLRLDRLVIVADATTDRTLLEEVARQQWQQLGIDSPNRGHVGLPLRVFHVEALVDRQLGALFELLLDTALVPRAAPPAA